MKTLFLTALFALNAYVYAALPVDGLLAVIPVVTLAQDNWETGVLASAFREYLIQQRNSGIPLSEYDQTIERYTKPLLVNTECESMRNNFVLRIDFDDNRNVVIDWKPTYTDVERNVLLDEMCLHRLMMTSFAPRVGTITFQQHVSIATNKLVTTKILTSTITYGLKIGRISKVTELLRWLTDYDYLANDLDKFEEWPTFQWSEFVERLIPLLSHEAAVELTVSVMKHSGPETRDAYLVIASFAMYSRAMHKLSDIEKANIMVTSSSFYRSFINLPADRFTFRLQHWKQFLTPTSWNYLIAKMAELERPDIGQTLIIEAQRNSQWDGTALWHYLESKKLGNTEYLEFMLRQNIPVLLTAVSKKTFCATGLELKISLLQQVLAPDSQLCRLINHCVKTDEDARTLFQESEVLLTYSVVESTRSLASALRSSLLRKYPTLNFNDEEMEWIDEFVAMESDTPFDGKI